MQTAEHAVAILDWLRLLNLGYVRAKEVKRLAWKLFVVPALATPLLWFGLIYWLRGWSNVGDAVWWLMLIQLAHLWGVGVAIHAWLIIGGLRWARSLRGETTRDMVYWLTEYRLLFPDEFGSGDDLPDPILFEKGGRTGALFLVPPRGHVVLWLDTGDTYTTRWSDGTPYSHPITWLSNPNFVVRVLGMGLCNALRYKLY